MPRILSISQSSAHSGIVALEAAAVCKITGLNPKLDGPRGTRIFQVRNGKTGEPRFRVDKGPVPGRGKKPHYHRRPDLSKHRPYEGW